MYLSSKKTGKTGDGRALILLYTVYIIHGIIFRDVNSEKELKPAVDVYEFCEWTTVALQKFYKDQVIKQ